MKRFLTILLVLAFIVPSAVASGPPPQGGTPPPPGGVPPIGREPGDTPAVDLANLPMPEGAKFAMELSPEKRDKGHKWVRSLTDEQRASIRQLLADNPLPAPDNLVDPAQATQSADELGRDVEKVEASLAEVKRWRDTISSSLAGILTPEQYQLYQDSLLPAPVQMAGTEKGTQADCAYCYLYGYYGLEYAYYFYLYAYYTYGASSDALAPSVYNLAVNGYVYTYYGQQYCYYAYTNYYNSTYGFYAYYFTNHAEAFLYAGANLAYALYTWESSNPNAYYSYWFGASAYSYITAGDNYAYACATPPPPPGNKYAVIVGIADFQYINDLNYTDDDAQDFRNSLINYGGFQSANINLLINSQATKANVQSAITSWLDSREGANDLVVIFYSSHGGYGSDVSPIDENDPYDEYLCTYNSLTTSYANDIRDDEFDSWLDNLESNKVVVIVDTCFSGGLIGSSAAGDGTARFYPRPGQETQATGVLPGDGFARDVNQSGRIVMTASAETEVSWEYGALQNGVFTYYLVEGLASSSADTNSNSWVSAEEAHTYLNSRVQSYTGNQQHPQQSDNISGQVDLTQPPTCTLTTISNGNFEQGDTVWTEYSTHGWDLILYCSETPVNCHGGSQMVWLGGDHNETSYIQQSVTVPNCNPIYLSYYHWIASQEGADCVGDDGYVRINSSNVKTYDLCSSTNTNGWVRGTVNMSSYAGQTVTLQFRATTDSSLNSNWFLDDVAWSQTAASSAETTPAIPVADPANAAPRPGASAPSDQGDKPPVGAPDETRPDASPPEAEYSLTADRDTVVAGECVTLKWHAQNVREAYLDGEGLVGTDGEKVDCPCLNKDYVLHVVLADGTTRDVVHTVTVKGECGAPPPQADPSANPRQ